MFRKSFLSARAPERHLWSASFENGRTDAELLSGLQIEQPATLSNKTPGPALSPQFPKSGLGHGPTPS